MSGARQVVVTGLGLVTPIGIGTAAVRESLREARSGIREWRSPALNKAFPAGIVQANFASRFTKIELPYLDRCTQMALVAASEALDEAGLTDFEAEGARAGVYYGTVRGGAETEESWVREFHVAAKQVARPYTVLASMLNAAAGQISIRHKIRGPAYTHSSACASSGAAIGEACRAIRDGRLDAALAGGAEASLVPSILAAWDAIRALAPVDHSDAGRSCRPFAKDRAGLVLAEGAVFLVLETIERARARGIRPYCAVSGFGMASDAHHIASPSTDGQLRALRAALDDAELAPDEIGYVNAHATATSGGDPIEAAALHQLFGTSVPVSATKSIHGHMLGAASAMELAVTALAVRDSFLPATAHLQEVAKECPLAHVSSTTFDHPIRHALSFSAGFGGVNVALVASAI